MNAPPRQAEPVDSPADAVAMLLAHVQPVDVTMQPLSQAGGLVLAADVHTDRPSPAVDVSAMDGFAVRVVDIPDSGVGLHIWAESHIGKQPPEMPKGGCVRISTGAPLPTGADCIIKREDVHEADDIISFGRPMVCRAGQHIRRAGENAPSGSIIAEAGARITPALIGALASFGVTDVPVHRPMRIAVISCGNEVIQPKETPTPYQIRDGNRAALVAMLGSIRGVGHVESSHAPDDEAALNACIAELLPNGDALVLTGGVSMGDRDLVPASLVRAGVRPLFHGVAQRPGRPMLGGMTTDGKPVLALPGNPVSTLICARRIGAPVLARRAGAMCVIPPTLVRLTNPDQQTNPLWWHRLVRHTADGEAEVVDIRSSGDFLAAGRADGFIEIPPGQTGSGPWPFYAWNV